MTNSLHSRICCWEFLPAALGRDQAATGAEMLVLSGGIELPGARQPHTASLVRSFVEEAERRVVGIVA